MFENKQNHEKRSFELWLLLSSKIKNYLYCGNWPLLSSSTSSFWARILCTDSQWLRYIVVGKLSTRHKKCILYLYAIASFRGKQICQILRVFSEVLNVLAPTHHEYWHAFLSNQFQAVIAVMLCTYMDFTINNILKWGGSTFINGIFSLKLLIAVLFEYEEAQDPSVNSKPPPGFDMFK